MRLWLALGVLFAASATACGGGGGGGENCGVATAGGEARFCATDGTQACVCATNRCARTDDTHCLSGWRYVYGAGECVPAEIVETRIDSTSVHDICSMEDAGADADADADADGDIEPDADGDVEPDADGDIELDADGDVEPDADGDVEPDADGDVELDADGDVELDGDGGITTRTTVMSLTGGGAVMTQGSFQLSVSVGAPQPMGSRDGGTRTIHVGPGAVRNQ